MKNHWFNLIILVVAFLLETSLIKVFSDISFLVPQLLLITILVMSILRSEQVIWLAFFAGFLAELSSSHFFGGVILAYILISWVTQLVTMSLITKEVNLGIVFSVVAGSTLAFPLIVFGYNLLLSSLSGGVAVFSEFMTWGIFWTVMVNLVGFYIIRKLIGLFDYGKKSF